MLYRIETDEGNITLSKAVIGKIVMESIEQFSGRVLITNHKGKIVRLKQKFGVTAATDNMEIIMGDNGLDIRIFIAIKFGTSIGMVTEHLIQGIKYDIERLTGLEANSIAVVVTGLLSKQMSRRNIEIKG